MAGLLLPTFDKNTTAVNGNKGKEENSISAEQYFVIQNTLAEKSLRLSLKEKDAESLHQFRVSIKKIKAVLVMLDKLEAGNDYGKTYAPYKLIFKCAGPIREQLLQRERACQLKEIDPKLIAKLNKDLQRATPAFLKSVSQGLPGIKNSLHKLDQQKIMPYCKNLLHKLKSKWRKVDNNKDIHKFRKELKQLLYCTHLLGKNEREKILSNKKLGLIDTLQDLIGHWHDNVLLLKKIKKEEITVNSKFISSTENETRKMLGRIIEMGNKL